MKESSNQAWIIPGKLAWVRHQENFKLCTITDRNETGKTADCKLSKDSAAISTSFNNLFEYNPSQNEYPDMCTMDVLNEPQILSNIKRRYKSDKIFTKIGPTLIVVNPYKIIEPLFNHKKLEELTGKVKANEKLDALDPHVYLIAGNAYNKLRISNKKQAIVISGESGAGKTENAKYCMNFLAALSHQHHADQKKLAVEDKILDCNPVLEAFGNSKTVRNSNSSRFGKYVRLYLDGMCSIKGAKIESYLLEKSRVVSVSQNQRNFHIFYCLNSHPSKVKYGLLENQKYQLLEQSSCKEAEGINDRQNFAEVDEALRQIGFSNQQIKRIWQTVASILLLGNVTFDDTEHQKNSNSPCQFQNKGVAARIQKLLGTSIQKLLLEQKRKHGKQQIVSRLNKVQCVDNRNTLIKALYNRMFDYIIEKMNDRLSVKQDGYKSIGLLDIFGFENFQLNSFQQLCINFTNEKLQKLYTRYVFETELEEIRKDGLGDRVKQITPPDNRLVIELIEKPRGPGLSIFSIIDDKTSFAPAKDEDIVAEIKRQYGDQKKGAHKHLTTSLTSKNTFTIIHTQSDVTYSIEGFKMKNKDSITNEIDFIIDKLFPLSVGSDIKGKTIIAKFDTEVKVLMEQLESSEVHFIRCIKPNEQKVKELLEQPYAMKQIRYLGVLETIKIRKSTFPFRKPYKQFNQICSEVITISPSITKQQAKTMEYLLSMFPNIEKQKGVYLMGNQRIYLSGQYQTKFNDLMLQKFKKKQQSAIKIQRSFKKYKFRKVVLLNLTKLVKKLRLLKTLMLKKMFKKKKLYLDHYRKQSSKATEVLKQKKLEEERRKLKQKEEKEKAALEAKRLGDRKQKLRKTESSVNNLIKVLIKYQKFLFFTKLKFMKKPQILNQTIILNESMYESVVGGKHEPIIEETPKNKKIVQPEQHQFNQSFLNEHSILQMPNQNIALKGELKVPKFVKYPGLKRLREVVQELFQNNSTETDEYYSPPSKDCNYDINTLPNDVLNTIVNFDYVAFFDSTLRVRTTLFGKKKSCVETLVAKDGPITKSLILLSQEQEKKAVECFKLILRLSEQQKIEKVFKQMQQIIQLLQQSSQTLKNQVFTQFIKQQNTKSELCAIRIYQIITIYIHVFKPDDSFVYSALNIVYSKITSSPQKKQNQYLLYLFPRMLKLVEPGYVHGVNYMPATYQMMALMCKRQISMPVFLSVGSSVIVRVQSYQTFNDIKQMVMEQLGINHTRLSKDLFAFFEIMNFQNEQLQEAPIDDSRNVWDMLTYWQRAKEKFEQTNIKPPVFIMMLKLRFAYECDIGDEESIELFYAQAYFDLFIGRVRPQNDDIIDAIAALRLLNIDKPEIDMASLIPMWVMQKAKSEELMQKITIKQKQMSREKLTNLGLKFRFLKACDSSKLCMAMSIPTEQQIQVFLRPKRVILAEKGTIHQQISIRKILKWSVDEQTLMLCVAKDNKDSKTIVIRTQHAQIVSKYLSLSAKLIMKKV